MAGKAGVGRRPGLVSMGKAGVGRRPIRWRAGDSFTTLYGIFALAFSWWQSGAWRPPYQVVVGRRRYGFTGFSALRSPCFVAVLVSGGLLVAGSARVWVGCQSPRPGGFTREFSPVWLAAVLKPTPRVVASPVAWPTAPLNNGGSRLRGPVRFDTDDGRYLPVGSGRTGFHFHLI